MNILIFALSLVLGPLALASDAKVAARLVFLGDSITEGYGLSKETAYPALVEKALKKEGFNDWEVVNAGISGSTSASATSRLKWLLKKPAKIVVLALGANDGLRGVDPKATRKNLEDAGAFATSQGARVIIAGMKMPPNYGVPYTKAFESLFKDLATAKKYDFIPFLLEGVAGEKDLNQADGIHPNLKGQEIVANNVLKVLVPIVRSLKK